MPAFDRMTRGNRVVVPGPARDLQQGRLQTRKVCRLTCSRWMQSDHCHYHRSGKSDVGLTKVSNGISNLDTLLRELKPTLNDGIYAWCVLPHDADLGDLTPLATIREVEGITVVLPEKDAIKCGLAVIYRAAWITLSVHSDLEAVGLTASFSTALAREGISCNVIAGAFHDHIFVPVEIAQRALDVLLTLRT